MRDLAWACFSAPMLDLAQRHDVPPGVQACALTMTPARKHWLQQLDEDPQALLEFLALQGNRRLGLYFEALWHFFLMQDTQTELVAHNLAVRSDGQTAGEFDILYYCRERQRHCHLELAVKYFLGTSGQGGGSTAWLGPNSRDRLDLKLAHMLEKQVQLSDVEAARDALRALTIESPDKEIALRGYLFSPAAQSITWPQGHTPTVKCRWLRRAELANYLPTIEADAYLALPRLRWLSPAVAHADDQLLNGFEMEDVVTAHLAQRSAPLLVAALNSQGKESERFFVTPLQWPATASDSAG